MVNNIDFTNRLKEVIEHYQLSASLFADKIGVQRSSISHILSGRNKPSLDFILKVTTSFPQVDIYWLLNGKGSFPKKTEQTTSVEEKNKNQPDIFNQPPTPLVSDTTKKIQKIVVFYSDGTFDEYVKN